MRLATLDERFKAFLVDYLLWGTVSTVTIIAIDKTIGEMASKVATVTFCLVLNFRDLGGRGVGKRICGLQVVRGNNWGKSPNPFALFIRSFFLWLWFVDWPFLLFTEEKQRLGDKVVGSVVIKLEDRTGPTNS